jgi:DNA-directed RNA polymerase subunit RPC12/RpoP
MRTTSHPTGKRIGTTKIIKCSAISLVRAIPLGGFIFGFLECKDCGGNVLTRLLVGCVSAFMSIATLGFPPRDTSGSSGSYNCWPHIIFCWMIFLLFSLCKEHFDNTKSPDQPRMYLPDEEFNVDFECNDCGATFDKRGVESTGELLCKTCGGRLIEG